MVTPALRLNQSMMCTGVHGSGWIAPEATGVGTISRRSRSGPSSLRVARECYPTACLRHATPHVPAQAPHCDTPARPSLRRNRSSRPRPLASMPPAARAPHPRSRTPVAAGRSWIACLQLGMDLSKLVDVVQVARAACPALHVDQVRNRGDPDFEAVDVLGQ